MPPAITSVKGMNDLLPQAAEGMDVVLWQKIEDAARRIFTSFGYAEIRTPVAEKTELFSRSIGTATDVVEKEMYTFEDGKESLTLRPEGTAGVVRALVEHGLQQADPQSRFWYLGPMFRRERPQKGRYRQFWQLGAESFGQRSPRVDAEQLAMVRALLDAVGIRGVTFEIGSLGDAKCRPAYREKLKTFLLGVKDRLCEDCQRRIETNPLRVLDCKKPGCREATAGAPMMIDALCEECAEHFREVKRNLGLLGVSFEVNPRIVRGLDYYVRTTFEFIHRAEGDAALGSQNAVGGGGRYDGLVKELGGGDVPGIGFGLGMERLVLVLQAQLGTHPAPPKIAIVTLSKATLDAAMLLARELRTRSLPVELADYDGKQGLKQQIERALRRKSRVALFLGEDELAKGTINVDELDSHDKFTMPLRSGSSEDLDALAAKLAGVLARPEREAKKREAEKKEG